MVSLSQDKELSDKLCSSIKALDKTQRDALSLDFISEIKSMISVRFTNNIILSFATDNGVYRSSLVKIALANFDEFLNDQNSNRVMQKLMIQEIDGPFGEFCLRHMNSRFIEYRNNLNFAKNVLVILEHCSIDKLREMREYIQNNPNQLFSKNYLNKSLIILLTKLPDMELKEFFEKIKAKTNELIRCKYGNFLIQELLTRDIPTAHESIQIEILRNLKSYLGLRYTKYIIGPLLGEGKKRSFTQTLIKEFLRMNSDE